MRTSNRLVSVFVFVLIMAGAALVFNQDAGAQIENCEVVITKSATPADNTVFIFELVSGEIVTQVPLRDPDSDMFGTNIGPGETLTVTELPVDGWELQGIECGAEGAIDFSVEGASVDIECLGDEGVITCVYNNVPGPRAIPTLSEWGLIAMAGILGLVGFIVIRKKYAAA